MTRLGLQGWPPWGWRGVSRGNQRVTDGLDGSALEREDASPGWREKLGVSLFRERPGYCVPGVHTPPSLSPLLMAGEQEGIGLLPGVRF